MKKNYIFGKNTLANALEHNSSLKYVFATSSFKDERIFSLLKKKKIPFKIVSNKEISSLVGDVNHQGIVGEVEDYKYISLEELIKKNEDNPNSLLVILW